MCEYQHGETPVRCPKNGGQKEGEEFSLFINFFLNPYLKFHVHDNSHYVYSHLLM